MKLKVKIGAKIVFLRVLRGMIKLTSSLQTLQLGKCEICLVVDFRLLTFISLQKVCVGVEALGLLYFHHHEKKNHVNQTDSPNGLPHHYIRRTSRTRCLDMFSYL